MIIIFILPPDIHTVYLPITCCFFTPLESSRRRVVPSQCAGRLTALCQSLCNQSPPNDAMALSERLDEVTSAFEALDRNAVSRKKMLESGLEQVCMCKHVHVCIYVYVRMT